MFFLQGVRPFMDKQRIEKINAMNCFPCARMKKRNGVSSMDMGIYFNNWNLIHLIE